MRQQVAQRDRAELAERVVHRLELGQVADDRVGELQQRAVTQLHHGDPGQRLFLGLSCALPPEFHEGGKVELAQHRMGEIAIRALHQQAIAILTITTQIGELVLVAPFALYRAGIGVECSRLADQVQRDVWQRQILLEHRCVTAPFRDPVPEHQVVIAEA